MDLLLVDTASHAETVRGFNGGNPRPRPRPSRAPANLENDFTARALDAREDYWCTETIYQNTTPATDDIYQNHTLTIDRPLDAYL